MKFVYAAAALAVLVSAMPVAAEEAQQAPAAASADQAAKPDAKAKPKPDEKLICTREAVIGSRMATKVCKTRSQIDAERAARRPIDSQRAAAAN